MDANAQPRRAEPDAPYRGTDVVPIESTEGLSLSAFCSLFITRVPRVERAQF